MGKQNPTMFTKSRDEDSEIEILDTCSTGFFYVLIFSTTNCISIVHHNYQILLLKKIALNKMSKGN